MPNLVGIGLSQVPTNSMLGGLAYQDPEHASIKDLDLKNLSHINSEISDTAVDVFVYDTRKDSDGGAWRKRTQHTSWYNETLGTSTRGTRREFPSVAVLVLQGTVFTIYDGDDPDLPMWMVFNKASNSYFSVTTNSCVTALNGKIVSGGNASNDRLRVIDFLLDNELEYSHTAGRRTHLNPISGRNGTAGFTAYDSSLPGIVNRYVNDVAMTVLPNAPIDDTTGLPVPTIAVATNGGVSVIKDDGIVVDINHWGSSGYNDTDYIEFFENDLVFCMDSVQRELFKLAIPSSDLSLPVTTDVVITTTTGRANAIQVSGSIANMSTSKVTSDGITAAVGSNGIAKVLDAPNYSKTLSSAITTSYNTGYMHGDIKGAFLSDTDTTNVTAGSALYTETFTGSGDNTWGLAGGASMSGGVLTLANLQDSRATDLTAASSLTTGQKYIAEIEIVSNTSQVFKLDDDGAGAGVGGNTNYGFCGSGKTGTFLIGFTKTASPRMRLIRVSGGPATITSFKIYTAEEQDRSVNNNGLKVFGTVTKSAVATGADLVAYSGWSSSNYLVQPYNSNLNFGTGDFSTSFWVYTTDANLTGFVFDRGGPNNSDPRIAVYIENDLIVLYTYGSAGRSVFHSFDEYENRWVHVVMTRHSSGVMQIFINGTRVSSTTTSVQNVTSSTNPDLIIGHRFSIDGVNALDASIALLRFSASIPSPEQIKKMYNDEKHLFEENAKATLYGSSDAVTALAYDEDTELLHVGTSAGRSDFQGLRRINNTTTAVTTAISASDDLIAEQ